MGIIFSAYRFREIAENSPHFCDIKQ